MTITFDPAPGALVVTGIPQLARVSDGELPTGLSIVSPGQIILTYAVSLEQGDFFDMPPYDEAVKNNVGGFMVAGRFGLGGGELPAPSPPEPISWSLLNVDGPTVRLTLPVSLALYMLPQTFAAAIGYAVTGDKYVIFGAMTDNTLELELDQAPSEGDELTITEECNLVMTQEAARLEPGSVVLVEP